MRIDMSRMAAAAIEAALEQDGKPRRRRRSGLRAVATGAALAVAARVAVSKAPGHVHVPHLPSVPDRVRDRLADRLADRGWLAQDDTEDDFDDEELDDEELDDEPEAEGDDDLEDEELEQEPEAEADEEEPDDDDEDEPEARGDEDEPEAEGDEEEPQAEAGEEEARGGRPAPGVALAADGDGGGTRGGTPDIIGMLGARRTPPVMARAKARTRRPLDPAARPPEPPDRESGESTSSTKRRNATKKAGSR